MAARFTNLRIRGKGLDTGISYPSLKRKATNLYLDSGTVAVQESPIMHHRDPCRCVEAVSCHTIEDLQLLRFREKIIYNVFELRSIIKIISQFPLPRSGNVPVIILC